ncbi:hypothetical protein [Sphingobium cloacae]|uniref:hypothetical protein n=1 Tax=Sphingobium cloacae TaxID=120107 RepID=UPI000F4F9902|nr:hypothetical protein [Sphingobium cloacae]
MTQPETSIDALKSVLLAHIIATERVAPGTAKETIELADALSRAAVEFGKQTEANRIAGILDELRIALGLPTND